MQTSGSEGHWVLVPTGSPIRNWLSVTPPLSMNSQSLTLRPLAVCNVITRGYVPNIVIFQISRGSLQCAGDDNRSHRNVCNMSLISFSLAVIFIIIMLLYSKYGVLLLRLLHRISFLKVNLYTACRPF